MAWLTYPVIVIVVADFMQIRLSNIQLEYLRKMNFEGIENQTFSVEDCFVLLRHRMLDKFDKTKRFPFIKMLILINICDDN